MPPDSFRAHYLTLRHPTVRRSERSSASAVALETRDGVPVRCLCLEAIAADSLPARRGGVGPKQQRSRQRSCDERVRVLLRERRLQLADRPPGEPAADRVRPVPVPGQRVAGERHLRTDGERTPGLRPSVVHPHERRDIAIAHRNLRPVVEDHGPALAVMERPPERDHVELVRQFGRIRRAPEHPLRTQRHVTSNETLAAGGLLSSR
jgi:hypothetical protein